MGAKIWQVFAGVDAPVAVTANRFQIFGVVRAAMGPKPPVMNLQQVRAAAPGAPPSVPIQNSAAVQSVDRVH
jgi:hypothetical protein